MKPLKLTMSAFGPYKNTEVVDFTELKEHHLFVISGNTGAGKTTIFDGISFALYGTASGQDRGETKLLRSDFADDDVHTAVELEFLLKGKHYRILRQPGHVKQGNKSKTGEKYEFYRLVGEEEVPCVDRQIVSEINEKVEAIIGLTQDQFKQIVMLPQGEFRKLLTSDTENKEAILRRLFKTESYKAINEVLRNKRSDADINYKQHVLMRDELINSIPTLLPMREEATIQQVLAAEHYNSTQVLAGLSEEALFFEEKIKTDETNYKAAVEESKKKQQAFHAATRLNERFLELETKEKQLAELESQKASFRDKEKTLAEAEKVNRIYMYEHARNQVVEEAKVKRNALDIAKNTFQQVITALEKAKADFTVEENKQAEREQTAKDLSQLEDILPVVQGLEKNKQEVAGLQKKASELQEQRVSLESKLKQAEENERNNRKQINELSAKMDESGDKELEMVKLEEQGRVFVRYRKLLEEMSEVEKTYQQQASAFQKVKTQYEEMEYAWLDNQALVLAEHLHDGKACPVCGSLDHPAKATGQTEAMTRTELTALKKEMETQEQSFQTANVYLQTKKAQYQDVKEAISAYTSDFNTLGEQYDALVQRGKEMRAAVNERKETREFLTKRKASEEQLVKDIEELEKKFKLVTEEFQQVNTALSSSHAVLQERTSKIPEELQVLQSLKQRLTFTKEKKETLTQAWENVQKELQDKKDAYTKHEAELNSVRKQLEELEAKRSQATEAFQEKLVEQGFQDEAAYLAAKLTDEDQASLMQAIETYKQSLMLVTEAVKELQKELENQEQIDLERLKTELNALQDKYELALQQLHQSRKRLEDAEALQEKIKDAEVKLKESEAHLSLLTDLHDTLRGQNSKKISFERYLQMEYLEQIIHSANLRLQKLSNNQYYLTRSDRQESHGKQSGLALDVYDSHTGQTRDVKSLSGGEKFHAALSLALGMSDVIQSFQGNISIETMFIDEGFGSLDEEALTKAIDALIELMESGRMIGVISHVKELKDIFPAILEVKKSKEGFSQTNFILK